MTDVIAERAADAAGASVYVVRHPDRLPAPPAVGAVSRRGVRPARASSSTTSTSRCRCTATAAIGRSTQLLAGGGNRIAGRASGPPRRGAGLSGGHRSRRDSARAARPASGQPGQPGARRRRAARTDSAGARHQPAQPTAGDDGLSPATSALVQGLVATAHSWELRSTVVRAAIIWAFPPDLRVHRRARIRPTRHRRQLVDPSRGRPTTSPAASRSSATGLPSPATPPGSPTSTPATAFAPQTHVRVASITKTFVAATIAAARRRGQGRPRRADRDLLARPHSRRGHRRQRDHGASAAAASERPAGVLRRRNAAARRTGDGGSAPRRGADATSPVRARAPR